MKDDAVLTALATQQRALEQPGVLGEALVRRVLGGGHVAGDGRAERAGRCSTSVIPGA